MAINIVTFISVPDLKQSGYIDENVDEKDLLIAIREAQDLYILPILGTGIYDELVSQITNNTVTSLNNTLLRTYILPCLKYYSLSVVAPMLNYKLTNKAIMKKGGENSETVNFDVIDKLIDRFMITAESYQEKIMLYLTENQSQYPLYFNPGSKIDTVHPTRKTFQTGWSLGSVRKSSLWNDQNNIEL